MSNVNLSELARMRRETCASVGLTDETLVFVSDPNGKADGVTLGKLREYLAKTPETAE